MASKAEVRFAFQIDGKPKTVLSVRIGRQGDLILNLKPLREARDAGAAHKGNGSETHLKRVIEQRFSVHPSFESKNGINSIKYTMVLDGGRRIEHRHYTKAIKAQPARFAPIYARRCGNLRNDAFVATKDAERTVTLAVGNPDLFTPFLAVFVTHKSQGFVGTTPSDMSFHQRVIGDFCLVIMWSFLDVPAHVTSNVSIYATLPIEQAGGDTWQGMVHGFDHGQAVAAFVYFRERLRKEFFETLLASESITRQIEFILLNSAFWPSTEGSPAYLEFFGSKLSAFQAMLAADGLKKPQ